MRRVLPALCLLASVPAFAHPHDIPFLAAESLANTTAVEMGVEGNKFASVPGWCEAPDKAQYFGSTHGGIVVDKAGKLYITSETKSSVVVYNADGKVERNWDAQYAGIHGLNISVENGEEFIYAAHLRAKKVRKFKLDGTQVLEIGCPMESGKYEKPEQWSPTGVVAGPDGRIYVVDGYGRNWIHQFDAAGKYVKSFGGPGNGPGQFKTCHGIGLDTRGEKPLLLICDRENRRLQHFDLDGNFVAVVIEGLRRPCSLSFHGKNVVIAELEARVTVLGADNKVITHLGDNPERGLWANHGAKPEQWREGIFTAPHGVSYDAAGNIFVMDWNASGRITKLKKL
jgi:DNA-binding beta-propeller fold protein YncE